MNRQPEKTWSPKTSNTRHVKINHEITANFDFRNSPCSILCNKTLKSQFPFVKFAEKPFVGSLCISLSLTIVYSQLTRSAFVGCFYRIAGILEHLRTFENNFEAKEYSTSERAWCLFPVNRARITKLVVQNNLLIKQSILDCLKLCKLCRLLQASQKMIRRRDWTLLVACVLLNLIAIAY